MSKPILTCASQQRRHKIRKENLNGLDYVEVELGHDPAQPGSSPTLCVHFLGKAPEGLSPAHVRIEGGHRILGRDIRIEGIQLRQQHDPELDDCLLITVDRSGDFSTYTLRLIELDEQGQPIIDVDTHGHQRYHPFPGFDPRYAQIEFSFQAGCPSGLDCKNEVLSLPEKRDEPQINYLAKDYASFRQLILDRLALKMPNWQEQHVPDLGITLVELLAYVGDHLSYYQDAVATEAYLDTARQRISVRRHTRLVDYPMHEGCNARTWVWVETDSDLSLDPREFYFITRYDKARLDGRPLTMDELRDIPADQYEVFQPLVADPAKTIKFYEAHNTISFYTWGDRECCLPQGATRATLRDEWVDEQPGPMPNQPAQQSAAQKSNANSPSQRKSKLQQLQPGDVLIFEEMMGHKTGNPADADPKRRHVVQLIGVHFATDALYHQPVVEIEWAAEDALPFPLCLSAMSEAPQCQERSGISVAHGNVVLVDHGWSIDPPEELGMVPIAGTGADCECYGMPSDITTVPGRFNPTLQKKPLTFSQSFIGTKYVKNALKQEARSALPQIILHSIPPSPDGQSPLFQWQDLADPTKLARDLAKEVKAVISNQSALSIQSVNPNEPAQQPNQPADVALQHLAGQLGSKTREQLQSYDGMGDLPAELRQMLMDDLKRLLQEWSPRRDLFDSTPNDRHFVVEMDDDSRAHLRFGDGELGQQPAPGTMFYANYRIGNGPAGNIGLESISHLVMRHGSLSGVTLQIHNPFPAEAGTQPEPLAEVKLLAPYTFRKELQRAITADDYARIAERNPKLQRAAASLRWNGSWYEANVAIDPASASEVDDELCREIAEYLYRFHRMGHDLVVKAAQYVPLEIEMTVCVLPHYLRGHVEAELLDVFSNRLRPDGTPGFFHPDKLTFGEGIYLSQLIAAAQAVTGVESVTVTTFKRFGEEQNGEIENGILPLNAFEIAQLDNDPSFPEHGKLTLQMKGGR